MTTRLRLFAISLLLLGSLSAEQTPWALLKVGMSAEAIISLLGDPIQRNKGRGFETWTYDGGAEVLIYGLVVGWTTPASAALPARSADVWSNHPQGDYFATLRSAVRTHALQSSVVSAAKPSRETPRANAGTGYEEYFRG